MHILGMLLHRQVDVHADRVATFLGKPAEQAGRAREQRESAQEPDRQPEVGEGRAAGAGPVERQSPAKDLGMDPADGLEQLQVRPAQSRIVRDCDQNGGVGIGDLVDGMTKARNEAALGAGRPDGRQG
jgi:hypothetical protein